MNDECTDSGNKNITAVGKYGDFSRCNTFSEYVLKKMCAVAVSVQVRIGRWSNLFSKT